MIVICMEAMDQIQKNVLHLYQQIMLIFYKCIHVIDSINYTVLYYLMFCHSMLCYAMLYMLTSVDYVMLFIVLLCTILYYTILYYTILYYTILYYIELLIYPPFTIMIIANKPELCSLGAVFLKVSLGRRQKLTTY